MSSGRVSGLRMCVQVRTQALRVQMVNYLQHIKEQISSRVLAQKRVCNSSPVKMSAKHVRVEWAKGI